MTSDEHSAHKVAGVVHQGMDGVDGRPDRSQNGDKGQRHTYGLQQDGRHDDACALYACSAYREDDAEEDELGQRGNRDRHTVEVGSEDTAQADEHSETVHTAGVAQRQGEAIDVLGDTQLLAGDLDGDGQSGGRRSGGGSNDHIPQ